MAAAGMAAKIVLPRLVVYFRTGGPAPVGTKPVIVKDGAAIPVGPNAGRCSALARDTNGVAE
jgi:hypothetical protein